MISSLCHHWQATTEASATEQMDETQLNAIEDEFNEEFQKLGDWTNWSSSKSQAQVAG